MKKINKAGYGKYLSLESVKGFQEKTPACYLENIKDFKKIIYKFDEERKFEISTNEYSKTVQRKEALSKINKALQSKLFNEILILNLDYPRYEQEKYEQEKERERLENLVKAKDPIAFGVNNVFPNYLFFIADWEDDFCDLTLDKLIAKL